MQASTSVSETFTEAKKRLVEQLSHEQDHKPSQRQIMQLSVGVSNITKTQDKFHDYVAWNFCPCPETGYSRKGCTLK